MALPTCWRRWAVALAAALSDSSRFTPLLEQENLHSLHPLASALVQAAEACHKAARAAAAGLPAEDKRVLVQLAEPVIGPCSAFLRCARAAAPNRSPARYASLAAQMQRVVRAALALASSHCPARAAWIAEHAAALAGFLGATCSVLGAQGGCSRLPVCLPAWGTMPASAVPAMHAGRWLDRMLSMTTPRAAGLMLVPHALPPPPTPCQALAILTMISRKHARWCCGTCCCATAAKAKRCCSWLQPTAGCSRCWCRRP